MVLDILRTERGRLSADTYWRDSCFDLGIKLVPEPMTQGEAVAAWMNDGYNWAAAVQYWNRITEFPTECKDRLVDDTSRKRIKEQLRSVQGA